MGTDGTDAVGRHPRVVVAVAALAVLLLLLAVVVLVVGRSTGDGQTSDTAATADSPPGTRDASATERPPVLDLEVLEELVPDGADEVERSGSDTDGFRAITFRVDGPTDGVVDAIGDVLRDDAWVLRQRDSIGNDSRAVYDAADARMITVDVTERSEGVRVAVVLTAP